MTGLARPSEPVLSTTWPAEPSTPTPYPPAPAANALSAPGLIPEKGHHERAAGEAAGIAAELLIGLPQQTAADHEDAGHANDRGPCCQQPRGQREQPDAHKA